MNLYPSEVEATLLAVEELVPHYLLVVDRGTTLARLEVQVEPSPAAARSAAAASAPSIRRSSTLRRRVRRAAARAPIGLTVELTIVAPAHHPALRGQGGARRRARVESADARILGAAGQPGHRDATMATDTAMMAKIERGVRLESADEMTAEYRDNLVHLLTMQADSELAGGYGYVPWITKAPTVEEKHVVAQIVKDELRHAAVMYGLLGDLGFDVDRHVRRHDETLTMRIDANADIGTTRITDDKRVNIFYYPIDTWADFVFFNFCMDRGAGHQLEDVRGCSYGPWVRAIEGIFKEEKFHIRHGEYWVKKLAEDPATQRRGPDDVRQVVHPHDEHLRPPRHRRRIRSIGGSSSSSVTTTRSRQAFATEVDGALREVRPRRPGVEARVVGAARGSPDPGSSVGQVTSRS